MNFITRIRQRLSTLYSEGEAEALARLIAEDAFGYSLTDCLVGKAVLNAQQERCLEEMMQQLEKGVPVQYALGKAMFCNRYFKVSPAVLIPRPETEDLVSLIEKDYSADSSSLAICDAGTGSGCIAISLQKEMPNSKVTALDISEDALAIARENALHLEADVQFVKADMLCPSSLPQGPWDVIVSNPPYVMDSEKADMEHHVKDFEPSLALFVPDNDALKFYKALAEWGIHTLRQNGSLYCEINAQLAAETCEMFRAYGYAQVDIFNDRFDKPRFVRCKRP